MGGKGSDAAAPAVVMPEQDNSQNEMLLAQMAGMMSQMSQMSQIQAQSAMPEIPAIPTVDTPAEIDWVEKQEKLASKMKAEEALDSARRKGRADTIHTSYLDDEEDTSIATSILAGK